MNTFMKWLSSIFVNQDKKPKWLSIFVIAAGLGMIIILMAPGSKKNSSEALSKGYANWSDMPAKTTPSPVHMESNETDKYLKKEELQTVLDQWALRFQTANQTQSDDSAASQLAAVMKDFKNNNDATIGELQSQQSQFQKDIAALKLQLSNSGSGNQGTVTQPNYNPLNQSSNIMDLPANTYSGNPTNGTVNNNFLMDTSGMSAIIVDNFHAANDPLIMSVGEKTDPGFSIVEGIKAGTYIDAILKTGCISSSDPCPVLVSINEDVKYKNQILIPKGTNFMGVGLSDYVARKIFIKLQKVVLVDREVDIQAHLVNKDGTVGFCSKYVDKAMQKFWPVFAMNFATGLLQTYKDVTYIAGGGSLLPQKIDKDTTKNAAIDGTTAGVTAWTDAIMSDARAQGAIIVVNANLSVKIFLDEAIPSDRFTRKY